MAISLKHKFASAKADGADASIVRPSNWNDEHDLTLSASKLLGRYSGTNGVAQEIALGSSLKFDAANALDLVRRAEVIKTADYTIVPATDNFTIVTMNKASAAQLSLPAIAGAANEMYVARNIQTTTVTVKANAAELIEGNNTLLLAPGEAIFIWPSSGNGSWRVFKSAPVTTPNYKWLSKGIGELYIVDTSKTGVDIPPVSDPDVTFIELTAGLTGSGAFNNGKLTTESVTGSAPLVLATAVISVSGSPMNGTTIDLLNTEERIVRPSASPGTKQNDAQQRINGNFGSTNQGTTTANGPFSAYVSAANVGSSGAGNIGNRNFDSALQVRTDTETRMKNVGVKAYMRVK